MTGESITIESDSNIIKAVDQAAPKGSQVLLISASGDSVKAAGDQWQDKDFELMAIFVMSREYYLEKKGKIENLQIDLEIEFDGNDKKKSS